MFISEGGTGHASCRSECLTEGHTSVESRITENCVGAFGGTCIIEGRILGENPNKPTIRIAHSQGPICFFISLPDTGTCSIYPETTFFDWYRLPGGLNELVLLGILAGAPEWAIPTGIFYFLFFILYIDALVRRKGHHEYLGRH